MHTMKIDDSYMSNYFPKSPLFAIEVNLFLNTAYSGFKVGRSPSVM
jgi:hypothetical protein